MSGPVLIDLGGNRYPLNLGVFGPSFEVSVGGGDIYTVGLCAHEKYWPLEDENGDLVAVAGVCTARMWSRYLIEMTSYARVGQWAIGRKDMPEGEDFLEWLKRPNREEMGI